MAIYVLKALDIGMCKVGWVHLSKSCDMVKKAVSDENKQSIGPNRHHWR